jgi:hypothetical protein
VTLARPLSVAGTGTCCRPNAPWPAGRQRDEDSDGDLDGSGQHTHRPGRRTGRAKTSDAALMGPALSGGGDGCTATPSAGGMSAAWQRHRRQPPRRTAGMGALATRARVCAQSRPPPSLRRLLVLHQDLQATVAASIPTAVACMAQVQHRTGRRHGRRRRPRSAKSFICSRSARPARSTCRPFIAAARIHRPAAGPGFARPAPSLTVG